VNAITGGNRCKALTIAGPASGNVTLAGSTALFIHDDITLPATGLTRTYTGAITLSGTGAGKTITTNGVSLSSITTVNGVGAEWALADALINLSQLIFTNGSFDTADFNLTTSLFRSNVTNSRTISLGFSTVSVTGNTQLDFGSTENVRAALLFNAETSQLNLPGNSVTFNGNNQTFYNVSFTSTSVYPTCHHQRRKHLQQPDRCRQNLCWHCQHRPIRRPNHQRHPDALCWHQRHHENLRAV
jgi:hypothetical protein